MRRLFAKAAKKEKQSREHLDQEVVNSKEYQALIHANAIMNLYDAIEKLGYDPLDGSDFFISARASASAFIGELLEDLHQQLVTQKSEVNEKLPSV